MMDWQPMEKAPAGEYVLGRIANEYTDSRGYIIGRIYDLHLNLLVDEWTGRWAECTDWAPLQRRENKS